VSAGATPFRGVLLDDSAVGGDNGKYRPAGTIRRWAEEGRPHRARTQRAWNDLRLLRHGHEVAVCQFAHIDPADQGVGRPF
jgi:hypothetical protein